MKKAILIDYTGTIIQEKGKDIEDQTTPSRLWGRIEFKMVPVGF